MGIFTQNKAALAELIKEADKAKPVMPLHRCIPCVIAGFEVQSGNWGNALKVIVVLDHSPHLPEEFVGIEKTKSLKIYEGTDLQVANALNMLMVLDGAAGSPIENDPNVSEITIDLVEQLSGFSVNVVFNSFVTNDDKAYALKVGKEPRSTLFIKEFILNDDVEEADERLKEKRDKILAPNPDAAAGSPLTKTVAPVKKVVAPVKKVVAPTKKAPVIERVAPAAKAAEETTEAATVPAKRATPQKKAIPTAKGSPEACEGTVKANGDEFGDDIPF